MTQRQIVLRVLAEANDWVPSYDLVKRAEKWGWVGTEGARRARELYEMGLIERKKEGKYSYFRFKSLEPRQLSLI